MQMIDLPDHARLIRVLPVGPKARAHSPSGQYVITTMETWDDVTMRLLSGGAAPTRRRSKTTTERTDDPAAMVEQLLALERKGRITAAEQKAYTAAHEALERFGGPALTAYLDDAVENASERDDLRSYGEMVRDGLDATTT